MRVKNLDLERLMSIPDVELAYIAGFFDGEGCVGIGRRGFQNNGAAVFNTYIDISQKKREVLDWIAERFTGTVRWRPNGTGSHNPGGGLWVWRIDGNLQCATILKLIKRFVIVKRDQVELVLQFCETRHAITDVQKDNLVSLVKEAKRSA